MKGNRDHRFASQSKRYVAISPNGNTLRTVVSCEGCGFPGGEELESWAAAEADPRAHGMTKFDLSKLDPRILMRALRPY